MNNSKQKLGLSLSDTRNQYLAYQEGQTGYSRGTYKRKRWLLDVSNKVARRGEMYRGQLERCNKT